MSRVEEEWVAEGHRGVFTRETRPRLRAGGGETPSQRGSESAKENAAHSPEKPLTRLDSMLLRCERVLCSSPQAAVGREPGDSAMSHS